MEDAIANIIHVLRILEHFFNHSTITH